MFFGNLLSYNYMYLREMEVSNYYPLYTLYEPN